VVSQPRQGLISPGSAHLNVKNVTKNLSIYRTMKTKDREAHGREIAKARKIEARSSANWMI